MISHLMAFTYLGFIIIVGTGLSLELDSKDADYLVDMDNNE